jgi:hypothetical protein
MLALLMLGESQADFINLCCVAKESVHDLIGLESVDP